MTNAPKPAQPVPITILTGFLGAGKTTLLNHLLHGDHGLRIAVLVNDFGSINIDTQLVVGVDGDMVNLSNGCVCCTLRGDLLDAVMKLIHRDPIPEAIIIETSGVSDPASVAMTFLMPSLRSFVRVDSIVTVVDAEQGGEALEGEQYFLAMSQVGVADLVVINKVDLVDADRLAVIREWIGQIVPKARILETTHGRVPLPLILGAGEYDAARLAESGREIHVHEAGQDHDHDHADHTLIFETWSWTTSEPLAMKALRKTIENLPLNIFRAKGIVQLADMPERRAVLHVVGKRASIQFEDEWNGETPHSQIVVIGQHGQIDAAKLTALFSETLASRQPANELERIKKSVSEWLRLKR